MHNLMMVFTLKNINMMTNSMMCQMPYNQMMPMSHQMMKDLKLELIYNLMKESKNDGIEQINKYNV